jgi:general secretion pathway protein D
MKALVVLLAAALAGCAANETYREGRALVEAGEVEEGLARIEQALEADPHDREMRNFYLRNRTLAVQRYLSMGARARSAGALDQAEAAYQRALRFDPDNARARAGLEAIAQNRRSAAAVAQAESLMKRGDSEAAYARAKEILSHNPRQRTARAIVRQVEMMKARAETFSPSLNAALDKTITIELRDAPVRAVFELIAKRTGLNFVYDRDVARELRTTVFVRDTPIAEVLRFVLVTNQLERRVLNENTLLIYPNTPQKAQAYKELVVRSFYLDNADAKQTANMVRSLAKTRDLYVDEKLNLLVIRDTPEAVRMVERLIASQDLPEPEVVLEVEVIEVGQTLLSQIGITWPSSASLSLIGAAGVPGQLSGREAEVLNRDDWRLQVNDPLIALQLRELAGRTNVLANPRIRVRNKEKARIHIGDRVPVITTTAGATGFVSESVNYLDVGLKLEVEPTVHLDDDVGIRVGLEVSNISNEVTSGAGTVAYQLGTRNAATVLRLHDGETQILAGLISDEDRRSATQVPGLAQLPVVGRLFRASNDTVSKTEIVLLITPHVVRNINRPGADIEHFNSGSELEVGGAGGTAFAPAAQPPGPPAGQAPAAPPPQAPAPAGPPPQAPAPAAPQAPAASPSLLPPSRTPGQQ